MVFFDSVETLENDEAISAFLQSAAEKEDERHFLFCLADVIRARGINRFALETGISRQEACDMFSTMTVQDNPEIGAKITGLNAKAALLRVMSKHLDAMTAVFSRGLDNA